ncbi:MAG: hypothetical protein K6G83_15210 [Lachnospiraceae bacterium]|nr:hypothetical protein [Lachnospiraceae bacterium]
MIEVRKEMIGSINKITTLFIAFACVLCLFAVPVRAEDQNNRAEAGSEQSEELDDYSLVVFENDEVPLAASPKELKKEQVARTVVITVIVMLLFIVGVIHIVHFSRYRERIRTLGRDISGERRKHLDECALLFSPRRQEELADELENDIASQYLE